MKGKFWLSIFIFVITLISCSAPSEQDRQPESMADAEAPPTPRIALVMKTLTNPFFVEMERGARRAEAELGIELIVKTAAQETSTEQQISIVDELIRDGVDAIVISPGDSFELIPVLKKAQDAGIVVINIDNRLDSEFSQSEGLAIVPFISVDNETAAYQSAKFISEQITVPTQAVILEGIRSTENAEYRKNGAIQAFSENENIELVAMETAHWKIDEGYDVTKSFFEDYPDIGAIFAANDMMALGAIQYLSEIGEADDVLIASFDALEEARNAIKDGNLDVTIDQLAAEQGYLGVQFAIRALAGETLPPETFIDVLMITPDTVE